MLAVTARATKVAVVRNLLESGQKGRIARRQGSVRILLRHRPGRAVPNALAIALLFDWVSKHATLTGFDDKARLRRVRPYF